MEFPVSLLSAALTFSILAPLWLLFRSSVAEPRVEVEGADWSFSLFAVSLLFRSLRFLIPRFWAGYEFTQLKVENKWRSLVQSHKDIKDSKKKTGEKRKTFQYHERLENILSKRHDIQPPFTSSSLDNNEEDKTSTSSEESKSSSISAVKRRGKRKQATNNDTVIQALKDIEKIRKLERDEREERAQERNALLREFLNILKEK